MICWLAAQLAKLFIGELIGEKLFMVKDEVGRVAFISTKYQ
jgi:hypothetical protein